MGLSLIFFPGEGSHSYLTWLVQEVNEECAWIWSVNYKARALYCDSLNAIEGKYYCLIFFQRRLNTLQELDNRFYFKIKYENLFLDVIHIKWTIHFSDLNQILSSVSILVWNSGGKKHEQEEGGACLSFAAGIGLLESISLLQWAAARNCVVVSTNMGLQSRIRIWGSCKHNPKNHHNPISPEPKGNWPKMSSTLHHQTELLPWVFSGTRREGKN